MIYFYFVVGFKKCSTYEKRCPEGVNNKLLIENGNVNSEKTWSFIRLRFIHYNMIMDAKKVIWFLHLWEFIKANQCTITFKLYINLFEPLIFVWFTNIDILQSDGTLYTIHCV